MLSLSRHIFLRFKHRDRRREPLRNKIILQSFQTFAARPGAAAFIHSTIQCVRRSLIAVSDVQKRSITTSRFDGGEVTQVCEEGEEIILNLISSSEYLVFHSKLLIVATGSIYFLLFLQDYLVSRGRPS